MKIKTWLQISIFLFVGITFLVGILNFRQQNKINQTTEKTKTVREITRVVNQRELIVDEYVNSHRNETIIQWQVMYDITVRLLQSKIFNTKEEQEILADMREDNVNINRIFTELIVLHKSIQLKIKDNDHFQQEEKKLRAKLLYLGESMIVGAYRLTELSYQNRKIYMDRIAKYTIGSMLIFGLLIVFILRLLRVKILIPLEKLNEGMKIIAGGDLNYKIDIKSQDEISEMLDSFNKMAVKLSDRIAQLVFTSEKLSESNKDLQQFVYIASHDLQEPLRVISSYMQLIERRYKSKLDKNAEEFITFAVDGAKRLQEMINDLLLFSRVQTNKHMLLPTNMEDMLKQAEQNLQLAIIDNKATITHDPLPVVFADKVQMIMLFQNLLSNAIKFHGVEPPIVHVSAERKKKKWQFSVRDNGIGIAPKNKDQLFTIFKRMVGKEYPGTGIGLAICKRIVERHHGAIWLESKLGKGSTFYFTIPDDADASGNHFA